MRHLIVAAAILPLAACGALHHDSADSNGVPASGTGASRTYQVADFTGVELRGPDNVDVKVGPAFSIRAEGDAKMLDELVIERVGNVLRVGRKQGFHWDWHDRKGVQVTVTLPSLDTATLTGSGDMTVDKASGDFNGTVAGSGDLQVGGIAATKANLTIAGSGKLSASGTADAVAYSIAGSGDLEARGLKAKSGSVSIAGSGDLHATIAGAVDVSILGSGAAEIAGGAKCTVNKVGSGEAHCA